MQYIYIVNGLTAYLLCKKIVNYIQYGTTKSKIINLKS